MIITSLVYLLSALVLITAFYVQGQRYIVSMIRGQFFQSILIASISFLLAWLERSTDLVILGILLIVLRGIIVTILLERRVPDRKHYIFEDNVNVPYLFIIDLIFIVVSVFIIYSLAFSSLVPDYSFLGSSDLLFPLLLFFQGIFLITSRKSTITQVIGYIEEENSLVLFALFLLPIPVIIEASVFLDVLALVIISVIVNKEKPVHEVMEALRG
ncbi:MAG: hypothetical protein M1402_01675 [Candidatus Thermoplasmatota archaeon]|nr:hypothetical protein [Candidatus Thermoplasmatota archaeon]MCL5665410.1 hypothetical protein [Candidatus Thermoplasmatota archaeon]